MLALTKPEFIEKFSWQTWRNIFNSAMEELKRTPEFKTLKDNKTLSCKSILGFDWSKHGYKTLILEIQCAIMANGKIGMCIDSYGLSNEDMPDEILDKLNEVKKSNFVSASIKTEVNGDFKKLAKD